MLRFCAALGSKTFNSFVFFLFTPLPLMPFSVVSLVLATGFVPNLLTKLSIRDSEANLSSSTLVQKASLVNFWAGTAFQLVFLVGFSIVHFFFRFMPNLTKMSSAVGIIMPAGGGGAPGGLMPGGGGGGGGPPMPGGGGGGGGPPPGGGGGGGGGGPPMPGGGGGAGGAGGAGGGGGPEGAGGAPPGGLIMAGRPDGTGNFVGELPPCLRASSSWVILACAVTSEASISCLEVRASSSSCTIP